MFEIRLELTGFRIIIIQIYLDDKKHNVGKLDVARNLPV